MAKIMPTKDISQEVCSVCGESAPSIFFPEYIREFATKTKVLIADDSKSHRMLVRDIIERNFRFPIIIEAEDGTQALVKIMSESPGLILLDWVMPGMSGPDICATLTKGDGALSIPGTPSMRYVVMMTSKNANNAIVEAFASGADDFLRKPFKEEDLVGRIGVGLRVLAMNNEISDRQKDLEFMSRIDRLTGLYNRKHIDDVLAGATSSAARKGLELSISLCDIDKFKKTNDRYGHMFGDIVLRETAKLFRENIRTSDVVGRWGGDEFLFVFPETSDINARKVTERIERVLRLARFKLPEGIVSESGEPYVGVSVTFGVASAIPRNMDDTNKIILDADADLYRKKASTKHQLQGVPLL